MVKYLLSTYIALDWNTLHTERKKRGGRQIHMENDWPKHLIRTKDWRRKRRDGLCLQGTHSRVMKTKKLMLNVTQLCREDLSKWQQSGLGLNCWGTEGSSDGRSGQTQKPDSAVDQDSSFHLVVRGYNQRISKKWGWRGRQGIPKAHVQLWN